MLLYWIQDNSSIDAYFVVGHDKYDKTARSYRMGTDEFSTASDIAALEKHWGTDKSKSLYILPFHEHFKTALHS